MMIERCYDVGFILSVLKEPEIFDAISEDGFNENDFKIDVQKDYWLEICDGDIEIGVVQFRGVFKNMWDAHIHILPQHRREYSREAGKAIWSWVLSFLPGCLIYTNVPEICPRVKIFLENFGFEEMGYLEKAWTKNGEQHGMYILTKRAE
jgi:hypothetical protein